MSETELKLALAKMLPEKMKWKAYKSNDKQHDPSINWKWSHSGIRDTEWLHVCWLIEETLTTKEALEYYDRQISSHHASWQQRAEAIIKVKPNRI